MAQNMHQMMQRQTDDAVDVLSLLVYLLIPFNYQTRLVFNNL